MNDLPPPSRETRELFAHERVARGYASARPFLHPEVFARVRELMRPTGPVRRALDVGCGTGLSSVALLELASRVVGLEPLFAGEARKVAFGGYIQVLRRL